MGDFIDQTNAMESVLLDGSIESIRNRKRELEPKDECHWCEEVFEANSPKLFCDSECRDDHQKHKRLSENNKHTFKA